MTTADVIAQALAPLLALPERLAALDARIARIEEAVRPKALPPPSGACSDLLTTEEAAEVAKVTPGTIREWTRVGRLRSSKAPGSRQLRLRRADLMAHLGGARSDVPDLDALASRVARSRKGR